MYYELKMYRGKTLVIRRICRTLEQAVYFYCVILKNHKLIHRVWESKIVETSAFDRIAKKRYVFESEIPQFTLMIIKRGKGDLNPFLLKEFIKKESI